MNLGEISGTVREVGGKGHARRLRANGQVPAVVYGIGGALPVSVSAKELLKLLDDRGVASRLINTKFEGDKKERQVLIKDLTFHPVTDQLLHLDLWEVDPNRKITVRVNIKFTGTPKGVKEQGGSLAIARHQCSLSCLPTDIPPFIELSVIELKTGQSLAIKDLPLPEKVKPLDDPELTIVMVNEPKEEEAATDKEEGEGIAPEGEATSESTPSAEKPEK